MQMRYWWRGMLWGVLPFLMLALYIVLRFSFSPEAIVDVSHLLLWTPAVAAFIGGFRASLGQGKEGLMAGLAICAGLWVIFSILMALFIPELFGSWLCLLLVTMLPGGVFGGISGMSIARMFGNKGE